MEIETFIQSVAHLREDLLRQATHYLGNADDAEDAVQETLLKLWVAVDRVADTSKMRNMSTVICRNVSLNMLRAASHPLSIESARTVATPGNPHERLEQRESRLQLRQSIRALTDKQRAIIRMRNVENMSYARIAQVIGTSESSVRGMMSKARHALLENMKKNQDYEG